MKRKVICYQLELRKKLTSISTPVTIRAPGMFSQSAGKLFSKLKLVFRQPSSSEQYSGSSMCSMLMGLLFHGSIKPFMQIGNSMTLFMA